jgi:hypothetical protein
MSLTSISGYHFIGVKSNRVRTRPVRPLAIGRWPGQRIIPWKRRYMRGHVQILSGLNTRLVFSIRSMIVYRWSTFSRKQDYFDLKKWVDPLVEIRTFLVEMRKYDNFLQKVCRCTDWFLGVKGRSCRHKTHFVYGSYILWKRIRVLFLGPHITPDPFRNKYIKTRWLR